MPAIRHLLFLGLLAAGTGAGAQNANFGPGPVFRDFGLIAMVPGASRPGPDSRFSIAFDISERAEPGKINRGINSAARFINMAVASGVKPENIRLALVVHGPASNDLLNPAAHAARHKGAANGSADAIAQLLKHNVRVILCGQSLAAHEFDPNELLPGVELSLSAMTAHAQLQQQGYTLNPF